MSETVNHPEHYGGDTIYETIKVITAWGLGFNLGNTVKYISRAGKKNPNVLEDLKKARFYLDYEIGILETQPDSDPEAYSDVAKKAILTEWRAGKSGISIEEALPMTARAMDGSIDEEVKRRISEEAEKTLPESARKGLQGHDPVSSSIARAARGLQGK